MGEPFYSLALQNQLLLSLRQACLQILHAGLQDFCLHLQPLSLKFTKSEVATYSCEHKKWSGGADQAEGNLQLDQTTQPHITAYSCILAIVLMYSCRVCIWHCLRQEQCKITLSCQLTAMLGCNMYKEMSKGDLSIIAAGFRAEELLLQALHHM